MAGSVNYLITMEDMTLTERKEHRRNAIIAAVTLAKEKSIAQQADVDAVRAGQAPVTVDIREFQNILDAGAVLDQWNTQALAAVGTAYSAFQAVLAFAVPANRVFVFYNVKVETIPQPVSRVTFRVGGAAGNIRGVFDLEALATQMIPVGYFSEPITYGPLDNLAVQVLCRIATGVVARVQFGTFVVETGGQVVA